jgi:hypothetical protein
MVKPGDIVEAEGRDGRWVVLADYPSLRHTGRQWNLRQQGAMPSGYVAPETALTVIASPAFEPGQTVRHFGEPAEIVADDGVALVRIRQTHRREIGRGPFGPPSFHSWTGESEVQRGALVAANINLFLQAEKEVEDV